MLSVKPKVIVLEEPTRGVDVGAKAEIHRILRDLANGGTGITAISSELPELIGLCDRVMVIHEGRLAGEVSGDDLTEENILHLASGLAKVHRYLGRDGILHEIDESLRRFGTDHIDLYITHWQDPTTPIEETMATLLDLKQAGKIRAIGISNALPEDLAMYLAIGPVDAIQERYSVLDREIERTLLPICRRNNIAALSYSSLALGLLSGKIGPDREFEGDDLRKDNPRFSKRNREHVAVFADALAPLAEEKGSSVAQVVVAWTIANLVFLMLCAVRAMRRRRWKTRALAPSCSAHMSWPELTLPSNSIFPPSPTGDRFRPYYRCSGHK